jgi:hypothetical protein
MTSHIASLFLFFVSLYSSSPPQTTIKKLSQSIINNMMTKLWCCWNRFVHRRLFDPESSAILHVCWWFVSQTLIAFFFITHAHNFIEWSFFSTILNDGKQTNKTRTIESIPFFFFLSFHRFFSRPQKVILLWIYRKIHDFYILHLILNDDKWPESAPESKIGRSIFFYCSNRFFHRVWTFNLVWYFFSSYQQYKQFSIFVHWMNETIYDNKEAVCMRPVSRNDVCDPGTSTATALHSHRSTTLSPLQTMVSSVKTMRVR